MTPREIIAGRLVKLVDRARELPRDAVMVVGRDASEAGVPWVRPGRTSVTDPRYWPAGLPLPLTVGGALDVLAPALDDIADDMLDELWRMVGALVPRELAGDVAEAVAAEWPLPDDRDTPRDRALDVLDAVLGPPYRPLYLGRERVIAEWAAGRLEATIPDFAAELRANAPMLGGMLTGWRDDDGNRWPAAGLGLLWLAELDARPRAYALDAAADVRAHLARLVDVRDPGPEFFAALDVATKEDPLADVDPSTRGRWAGDVIAAAQGVARKVLDLGEPTTEDDARAAAAAAAEVLAAALAKLGTAGQERADKVRAKADERAAGVDAGELRAGELWALWRGTSPPRWIEALARVLWADVWRPERVRMTRPVALYRANARAVIDIVSAVDVSPGADGGAVLVNAKGKAVSRFDGPRLVTAVQASTLDALALDGVGELASVFGARFVAWFAHQAQRRPNPSAPLVYVGGDGVNAWGTVAKMLGATNPDKDAPRVRALLWALHFSRIDYPDGRESGVLMVDFDPGSQNARGGRGKVSTLTITPGKPWLTGDAGYLPEGAEHRALAPIPALPGHSPPFVGDRRERGPIGRLWYRILSELAHGSDDIARGLGAPIPGPRWAALAREEGVMRPPPLLVGLLQDRWTQDGDDAPAILERVGPDRWHLGPAFAAERELLEAGGKERIGASEGGKRSAAERRAARVRLADGVPGKGRRKPRGGRE